MFVTLRSPKLCSLHGVLGIIGKLLMKRGAQALICGVLTHSVEVIEFGSFYELENEKIIFTFIFIVATTHDTLVIR